MEDLTMKTFGQKFLLAVACVSIALAAQAALGDWSPGDACKMHYPQRPDPNGWDVCLRPMAVADDFRCRETGRITGIHFWISWKDDIVDEVLDWTVSIDATINRAHQHATNTTRPDQDTGGWVELHESAAARV